MRLKFQSQTPAAFLSSEVALLVLYMATVSKWHICPSKQGFSWKNTSHIRSNGPTTNYSPLKTPTLSNTASFWTYRNPQLQYTLAIILNISHYFWKKQNLCNFLSSTNFTENDRETFLVSMLCEMNLNLEKIELGIKVL